MKKTIFKILTIFLFLLTKPLLANTDQEYINEYKPEIDKFINQLILIYQVVIIFFLSEIIL